MLIMALTALFTGILIYTVIRLLTPVSEAEIVKERISKFFDGGTIEDAADQIIRERYLKNQSRKGGKNIVSRELEDYIAGSGLKIKPIEFLLIWAALIFGPIIIMFPIGAEVVSIIAVVIVGFAAPPVYLFMARKKMQEKFTLQLAEALVIMGNAVRGGFTFQQTMLTISNDMMPPISSEFAKVVREISYGVGQEEALKNMGDRMKNSDLDLLIAAVLTTSRVGGNLSEIMDIIASTIKDRIRIKQEVKALTASGRMSAMVIGLLPVVVLLAVMMLSPDYFEGFFDTDLGKMLAVISVILEGIGFFIISKITDVQY